jgi:hypothetical protein
MHMRPNGPSYQDMFLDLTISHKERVRVSIIVINFITECTIITDNYVNC